MAQFEGTTLLPEQNDDEKKDLLTQRRFLVQHADGSEVTNVVIPIDQRSVTYSPVDLGETLTISVFDIDEAGNQNPVGRVEQVLVADTEAPTAVPGALLSTFAPIIPPTEATAPPA